MRSRPRDEHPGPGVVSESAVDIEETPDLQGAYPRLAEAHLTTLAGLGRRRAVRSEEILFREGERDCDFFVILAGKVALIEGRGTLEERLIGVHGRGRFLGELGLLTDEGSFYTAITVQPGEVLAVPAERLKEIIARDSALGDLIVRAYLTRRAILIDLGAGLRIIGSRYSPDTRRVREFAARNRVPYRWLDLETDPAAETFVAQAGVAAGDTPIVIVHGRLLRNPGNAELAAAIGLPVPATSPAGSDLVVVGAGPAGLSAAVYGASEGLRVLVLDGTATGGQAGTTSRIENYLGFPAGISGAELAERAMLQARKFGAQFAVPAEAGSVRRDDGQYVVTLDDGTSVTATSVVAASGARYRRLQVPRAEYFERMSIYYAASQAEALMCRGDPVVIVGGGNSAGQAAVFLSRHAARVTMAVREADLSENMSRYLIDQVERIANVDVVLGTEIRELLGDRVLEAVTVEDR
ncbi:MAG TPA: FAD-dependent oxidoreductase, partial [Streptosporangiaceae bacterium]|nr:FAD-dependent oxidoreductase [Streptosporangiaceae bacterium]